MSNPLDTDVGSELFGSYEAELKLVQADLNQRLDQIPELTGEPRKAAVRQADRALEDAKELVGGPFLNGRLNLNRLLTILTPARPNAYRKTKYSRSYQI